MDANRRVVRENRLWSAKERTSGGSSGFYTPVEYQATPNRARGGGLSMKIGETGAKWPLSVRTVNGTGLPRNRANKFPSRVPAYVVSRIIGYFVPATGVLPLRHLQPPPVESVVEKIYEYYFDPKLRRPPSISEFPAVFPFRSTPASSGDNSRLRDLPDYRRRHCSWPPR